MSKSPSSTSQRRRRDDDDGCSMRRLRETVDHQTGEVYHVETTRQAKRRYMRSGGVQHKPTVGQINAADIWNKQEEKIKRDREREEKRRREKLKQEAKDARQKEIQQEMLQKGKISLEDTWGKIRASQNRIHRFFGAPRAASKDLARALDSVSEQAEDNSSQAKYEGREGCDERQAQSLLSHAKTDTRAEEDGATEQIFEDEDAGYDDYRENACGSPKDPISQRSPLSEMTPSEVRNRANTKPDADADAKYHNKFYPVATQVVKDTLVGLCSQDFDDDLVNDEKENKSPLSATKSSEDGTKSAKSWNGNMESELKKVQEQLDAGLEDHIDIFDGLDSDTFDDEGIDDESLASLAATQQLKHDMFNSSRSQTPKTYGLENIAKPAPHLSFKQPEQFHKTGKLPINSARPGDSFAMEGIDDQDLLQGLEDFENDTEAFDDSDDGEASKADNQESSRFTTKLEQRTSDRQPHDEQPKRKKRRTLPWDKNPISVSCLPDKGDNAYEDSLTPSPASVNYD